MNKPSKVQNIKAKINDDKNGENILAECVARETEREYDQYAEQRNNEEYFGWISEERSQVQAWPLNVNVLAGLSHQSERAYENHDL